MGTYHLGFTHVLSDILTPNILQSLHYWSCAFHLKFNRVYVWTCECPHSWNVQITSLCFQRAERKRQVALFNLLLIIEKEDWVHFSNTAAKEYFLLVACFRLSWMHFHFIDFWILIFFLPSFISYLYACNDTCGQSKALKEQTFKTLASKADCD